MKRSGVAIKLLQTVLLSFLLFALLSSGLFMLMGQLKRYKMLENDMDSMAEESSELLYRYWKGELSGEELLSAIAATEQNWDGNVVVLDEQGNALYGAEKFISLLPDALWQNPEVFMNDFDFFTQSSEPMDNSVWKILGKPVVEGDRFIGAVILFKPLQIINSMNRSSNITMAIVMVIILPVTLAVTAMMLLHMMQPLSRMRNVALLMAQGDFSSRADETLPGEVGELGRTLNILSENLSATISALRLERNRLDHILNSLSEGIIAVDTDGHITHLNRAAVQLLGSAAEREPADLPHMLPATLTLDDMDAILHQRKTVIRTLTNVRGMILRLTISPLCEGTGTVAGAVALIQDITESERLEQTRRDYVSNVSHELRSPLTAMRGLLEPLSEGLVTDEADQQRYYGILLHETLRLSKLINDLLELSRLQSGNGAWESREFDLNELLGYVADKYQSIAEQMGISLRIGKADRPYVRGNENRVEQLLVILLDNAFKFTGTGGSVSVDVAEWDGTIRVTVRDTGEGIDEKDLPHIFDRFYMADRAHGGDGTGLGLAIAWEIAEKIGETLTVESRRGQGSAFTFTIGRNTNTTPEDMG